MKKTVIAISAVVLVVAAIIGISLVTMANDLPFVNLFEKDFQGYTSDEGQVYTADFWSSKPIAVTQGKTLYFGPCEPNQYFQLVGQDASGKAVTDKIRGKDLTVVDTFGNKNVIYSYTVPAGVSKVVFSVPAKLEPVFAVSETEISELIWRAYWGKKDPSLDLNSFVGKSAYFEVAEGQKLYFGAVTEEEALASEIYNADGESIGTVAKADLRLVESFGGSYGIYCYTVPSGVRYVNVNYDHTRQQYFNTLLVPGTDNTADKDMAGAFVTYWGIERPSDAAVKVLSGKTALFLGDSITYGARDRQNIYGAGSWAGRIGYYAGMDVTNNGVSGACITTARKDTHTEGHYIFNNLKKTEGTQYDYVIMHGLFNDASIPVELGTAKGPDAFDPAKADVSLFADALELLFYQAKLQNPNAILGYIVNFETERANVNQTPYVELAIEICKAWDIPYLDLFHKEGFTVEFDDGLHPSSRGYDGMYTLVANWMATLGGATIQNNTVMSYNVYYGSDVDADKGFTITDRYAKVAAYIKAKAPDILLLQECTDAFLLAGQSSVTGYTIHGEKHTSGSDERAPILWKTDKYTLVEKGAFWASDTPDTPYSGNWCAGEKQYYRAINWVVLKENTTGKLVLVMNVHGQPDINGADNTEARNKTMALVIARAEALLEKHTGAALVIGGDLNTSTSSEAYRILTQNGLNDVREAVNFKAPGSYNDWDRETNKFAMGDYLFVGGSGNAGSYKVLTDDLDTGRSDGKTVHISDHCPIIMELLF